MSILVSGLINLETTLKVDGFPLAIPVPYVERLARVRAELVVHPQVRPLPQQREAGDDAHHLQGDIDGELHVAEGRDARAAGRCRLHAASGAARF